jgi:hypothetical protein
MISPDSRADILESLRAGCSLDVAAKASRTTAAACRDLAATDEGWRADLAAAEAEGAEVRRAAEEAARAKVAAPAVESPSWADAAAMLAAEREAEDEEPAKVAPTYVPRSRAVFEEDAPRLQSPREADKWARIREEAAALGPEKIGYLHWVDRACVDARPKLHPMDPVWLDHYCRFYESGKRVDVARKGLRAGGSDSSCRVIVAELLLLEKTLEPGLECVGLVVSANTADGEDRFDTIKQNLRACGFRELTGRAKEDDDEEGRYRTAGGGNSGRVISLADAQGNPIQYRITAANEAGVASCTAGTALGDELDLWGRKEGKNPAKKIVEVLITRVSTVPGACVHLMSATYDRDSEHALMMAAGDTVRQRVSRLGVLGARLDTEARGRLAALLCSSDPLLLTPGDPLSTDLPTWVTNPTKCPIETCYELADGNLARMISLYGARPDIAGTDDAASAREQIMGIDALRGDRSRPIPQHPGYPSPGRPGVGRRFLL